jgi:hypothetical protein
LVHSDIVPPHRSEYTHTLLTDYANLDQYLSQTSFGNLPESANDANTVRWESVATRPVKLTNLEALMRGRNVKAAILLLQRKLRVEIPDASTLPLADAIFGLNHTLDYLCLTPMLPGFSVILPPDGYIPSNSWEFNLDLTHPLKPLKVKVSTMFRSCFIFLLSHYNRFGLAWRAWLRSRRFRYVHWLDAWAGHLDRHD